MCVCVDLLFDFEFLYRFTTTTTTTTTKRAIHLYFFVFTRELFSDWLESSLSPSCKFSQPPPSRPHINTSLIDTYFFYIIPTTWQLSLKRIFLNFFFFVEYDKLQITTGMTKFSFFIERHSGHRIEIDR